MRPTGADASVMSLPPPRFKDVSCGHLSAMCFTDVPEIPDKLSKPTKCSTNSPSESLAIQGCKDFGEDEEDVDVGIVGGVGLGRNADDDVVLYAISGTCGDDVLEVPVNNRGVRVYVDAEDDEDGKHDGPPC